MTEENIKFSAFHYAMAKLSYYCKGQKCSPSPTLRAAAVALYLQHKDDADFDFNKIDEHLYKYDLANVSRDMRGRYDHRPYHNTVEDMVKFIRDDSRVPLTVLRNMTVNGECLEWNNDVPAEPKDFASFLLYPQNRTDYEEKRFSNVVASYIEEGGRINGTQMSHHAYAAVDSAVGFADGDKSAFHYFALMAFLSKNKTHDLSISLKDIQWNVQVNEKINSCYTRIRRREIGHKVIKYGAGLLIGGGLLCAAYQQCSDEISDGKKIEMIQEPVAEQDPETLFYTLPNGQQVIKP